MKLGEVSERLMVPLSKSGLRILRSVGSNPTLSAKPFEGVKGNEQQKEVLRYYAILNY